MQKLYGGTVDPQGNHLYPGHEAIGSELGWQGWVVGMPGMPPMAAQIGNGYLKYLAFVQSPPASYSNFSRPTSGMGNQQGQVVRTRPVFPYPMQARYKGQGSIDDAANFIGFTPTDKQLIDGHFSWLGNDLFQASVSSSSQSPNR